MINLVQALKTIQPSLAQKNIIPTKPWSPFSVYTQIDKSKLSIRLSALSMIEAKRLESLKRNTESDIDSYTRRLKELKKIYAEQEEKLSSMISSNNPISKQKQIEKILSNLLIQHIEFVDPAVTIFTTEFIKKGQRVLGIFRIWIDWSCTNHHEAIKIINIYKRAPSYDHPCINNGSLCMGTAESTIQKHFQEKNVYILLETLIAFLVSENVSHGYINNWDAWSNQCSKLKKEFKFSELYITPKNYSSGGVTSSIMNEIIERLNKEYVVNSHGMLEEVNKKEGL